MAIPSNVDLGWSALTPTRRSHPEATRRILKIGVESLARAQLPQKG